MLFRLYRIPWLKLATCLLMLSGLLAGETEPARPKIGLALSGGGALGFAHIGTLKLLDSLDIPIDYIAGTSMGGIAGALYAVGYSGAEIETLAYSLDWQELFTDQPTRPLLPFFQKIDAEKFQFEFGIRDFRPVDKGGVIAGQKIALTFARLVLPYLHVHDFGQLPIPFRCVAVDLMTGNEVVLKSGSLPKAMRATMAVPSIFSPVEWGDSLLVDGGLLNNLPVDVVQDMGADFVIASVVRNPYKEKQELRTTLDVLAQSFNILRDNKLDYNADKADILIRCYLKGSTPADFINARIGRIISTGEIAAHNNLDKLLALKQQYHLTRSTIKQSRPSPQAVTVIGKISITGNQTIPQTAIRACLNLTEGDPYVADTLKVRLDRLAALGDYRQIRSEVVNLEDGTVEIIIRLLEELRPIIYAVDIRGNKRLSFDFIYRSFGVEPGDIFAVREIEERINYLNGLGYFKNIYYEIEPLNRTYIRLILQVTELPPQKLRVGVRYDDYHQLIAALDYQSTSALIRGLRWDAEWQFIGLDQFKLRALYPSRRLSYPLYPFAHFDTRHIPTYLYSLRGNKIARYFDRSTQAGVGFGLLWKNYWNFEAEGLFEHVDIRPDIAAENSLDFSNWKDRLWKMVLASNFDLLDNAFAPRTGLQAHFSYERAYRDDWKDSKYTRVQFYFNQHFSRHHHYLRLYGYYGYAYLQGFSNRFVYQGGPECFTGVEYDQLIGTRLGVARCDYAYELLKNLFLRLSFNTAFNLRNSWLAPGLKPPPIYGYGCGVKFVSPVGPFNLLLGYGDKSVFYPGKKRLLLYFTAGYNF